MAMQEEDEVVLGRDLADRTGVPPSYLSKVMLVLNRAGLVEATRGKKGGYRLSKSAEDISLFEIVEPVDTVSRLDDCIMGLKQCSEENPCAMHDWWKQVRDDYLARLRHTTLAEVSDSRSEGCLAR